MPLAKLSGDGKPALSRHVHVADDYIWSHEATKLKNFIAAQHRVNLMALIAKQRRERGYRVPVIVSQYDSERLGLRLDAFPLPDDS